MTEKFEIEFDHFAAQVARVKELTDQMNEAESSLQSSLHGAGRCWGDDDPGSAFEGCYAPQAKTMSGNSSATSDRLARFEGALDAMAKGFKEHEHDNTSELLRAGRSR